MAELAVFVVVGSLFIIVKIRMIFQSLFLNVKMISVLTVSLFLHLGSGILYLIIFP